MAENSPPQKASTGKARTKGMLMLGTDEQCQMADQKSKSSLKMQKSICPDSMSILAFPFDAHVSVRPADKFENRFPPLSYISFYVPALSSPYVTSTCRTYYHYLLRFPIISMAFCCLWIWVFAACWNVFFHCQNTHGLNATASVPATVSINGDKIIAETDDDFICATIDWWPPEKCDYGTCSWGNASLLNLVGSLYTFPLSLLVLISFLVFFFIL